MPAPARRRPSRAHTSRPRSFRMEQLEPRLVLYAVSGYEWTNPNVSFSFVPEGASVEGYSNTLFSRLNAIAPTNVWQREFARALQTWANVSNLNFHLVADSGAASGTAGSAQGDSRFGDIRLAMHALGGPLAYAYYPTGSSTLTGDIFLSTEFNFQVGANYDVYSTLLHEAGHTLGLRHSAGSVMNSSYQGVLTGPTADDIAGIQAIYGSRQHDAFDAVAGNDSLAQATAVTIGADGKYNASGDLQTLADVDYYAFAAPQTSNGSFTISIDAAGLSLLAPKVAVYNASGTLLGQANVGAAYGTTATVTLSGVAAGEVLYVMADGATGDAFGMGAYRINAAFGLTAGGGGGGGGEPVPPPEPSADRYEPNNTLAAAANLGKFNNSTFTGVSLHNATDVDYYRFSVNQAGTFQISTRFAAGSASTLTVYNSDGTVLEETAKGAVVVSLAKNATTFVRVSSPAGAVDVYDLVFTKIGNAGHPKGQQPGNLTPDPYYAEGGHDDHHGHGVERHGEHDSAMSEGLWTLAAASVHTHDGPAAERAAMILESTPRSAGAASAFSGNGIQISHAASGVSAAADVTSQLRPSRRDQHAVPGSVGAWESEWVAAADELAVAF